MPRGCSVAWRGVNAGAPEYISTDVENAIARGEGRGIGGVGYFSAVLYNGLGRYEAALAAARQACEYDDLGLFGFSLVELVEAGARSGAREEAATALRRLEERTSAVGTDWALGVAGVVTRAAEPKASLPNPCTGRRSSDSSVVASPSISPVPSSCTGSGCVARTAALTLASSFEPPTTCSARLGAEAYAERARRELVATGETARAAGTTHAAC